MGRGRYPAEQEVRKDVRRIFWVIAVLLKIVVQALSAVPWYWRQVRMAMKV